MTIQPLHDCVLVKRLTPDGEAHEDWFLPHGVKEESFEALIVSAGSGRLLESGKVQALSVKVGDRVLVGRHSGTEVALDGEVLIVLRENDILGILENSTRVLWPPKVFCSATTPLVDMHPEHSPRGHGHH
ncbi:MAG: co-chaperone GroES [Myxococcota bacterium]|jgi:chaperonin GroES|nr:co-chaperone GroES [Myxococcota bacterium]